MGVPRLGWSSFLVIKQWCMFTFSRVYPQKEYGKLIFNICMDRGNAFFSHVWIWKVVQSVRMVETRIWLALESTRVFVNFIWQSVQIIWCKALHNIILFQMTEIHKFKKREKKRKKTKFDRSCYLNGNADIFVVCLFALVWFHLMPFNSISVI